MNVPPCGDVIMGEAVLVWGKGEYGKSLDFPLNVDVNWNCPKN